MPDHLMEPPESTQSGPSAGVTCTSGCHGPAGYRALWTSEHRRDACLQL